jgi:AraC-like DNA-binding protein
VRGAGSVDWFEHAASEACAPVRVRPDDGTAFVGALRGSRVGDLVIAHLRTSPSTVRRSLLCSTDPEFVKIAWQRRGSSRLEQDGRRCVVTPGSIVAYETIRRYLLHSDDPRWEALIVAVPRARLGAGAGALRTAVPVSIGSGPGRALALLVEELARSRDSPAAPHLADAVASTMLAVYAGLPDSARDKPGTLAERVRMFSLANLSDPGLRVDAIAGSLGVSVRQVHKACAAEGFTVAAWIRRERLERIRRDLADPALASRGTAAIAHRWGLLDASHLARQFRAAFGELPAR